MHGSLKSATFLTIPFQKLFKTSLPIDSQAHQELRTGRIAEKS
jgi:hypothetical protein